MWPNESAEYRTKRNALLKAEANLRAQSEAVAEMRRTLPDGGEDKEDYEFLAAATGDPVRLTDLFEEGKDTLFLYSFMYAPGAENPCPMCASMLDSLDGAEPHVGDRINVAIVAKAPTEPIAIGQGSRLEQCPLPVIAQQQLQP